MSDQLITCPNCQHQFSITSTLAAQIRTQIEEEQHKKQHAFELQAAAKLKVIEEQEKKLLLQQASIEDQVKQQTEKEKQRLWAIAQSEASKKFENKLKLSEEERQKIEQQLKQAEENELKLLKQQKELEENKRRFEIEKARQLEAERKKIEEDAKKLSDEEHRLKFLEKEKQLQMMRTQIEELKRKSEQGSMQIQGEVQEDDLKTLLQTNFPQDQVVDVEKGVRGADLVQTVYNSNGQRCGVIVWESKNTKDWKDEWISKLRDDQHRVQGDICVLVTKALPKGSDRFALVKRVWVVHSSVVLLLTHALRAQLMQVHALSVANVGKEEKMELLYHYLSGSQFKSRIENIVNAFMTMQDQLAAEKRAMNTIWNRREKEITRIVDQTTGMYGELQGIIGSSLQPIASLELPDSEQASQPSLLSG